MGGISPSLEASFWAINLQRHRAQSALLRKGLARSHLVGGQPLGDKSQRHRAQSALLQKGLAKSHPVGGQFLGDKPATVFAHKVPSCKKP